MKKHVWLTILILVTVIFAGIATAQAEIIPPYGEGQIGLSSVVLCESLTIREAPNANAGILDSLEFGRRIIVMKQEDGWALICLSDDVDGGPAGYVNADYLAIDPAWYRTERCERTEGCAAGQGYPAADPEGRRGVAGRQPARRHRMDS